MSLFLLAGSIVSTLCSCAATDSSAVVGYVDEHPITMEEFNYFLSQQKSSVCQSYSQLYGITSFDSAFWNSEYGDSTPLDSARASAKEACLEAYATQMLAEKTTSAEFLSFSQLKENQDDVDTYNLWMEDIYIGHNYIEDVAQGGIDLCDARNAVVEYNVVDGFLKRYPNFRPTVALYPWKCENSVLQYNEVYNGPSTNADGSPYDMDSALKNVVYQFNYSHNNPCGWMLYMGRNTNDIIRYNISDDGGDFIIKYFLTANATPAYFVNNVIMYDGARTTFMHRDPFKSQTYFYNNVFYNKSTTTTTTWHDTKRYLGNLGSVTFSHNCFYEASGIHSQYEPADDYKVTENPDIHPIHERKGQTGCLTIYRTTQQ